MLAELTAALAEFPPPDEIPAGWSPPAAYLLDPEHLASCTLTARWLAERLGGVVMGYQHDNNPTARLGEVEFGHDFAFIDRRWIVDWWATEYGTGTEGHPGVLDLADPHEAAPVRDYYGDQACWETLP